MTLKIPDIADKKLPRALLVSLQLPGVSDQEHAASLAELGRLVHTLGMEVVESISQKRSSPAAGSVVGDGKLKEIARWTGGTGIVTANKPVVRTKAGVHKRPEDEEIEDLAEGDEAADDLDHEFADDSQEKKHDPSAPLPEAERVQFVVFDNELTPTQLRNLGAALGVDVLDRTGVIVEIFYRHAKTPAARAQVEIARLTYLAPRIRVTGAGERQGGGIGAKGVGETAHELESRRIRDKIAALRREIEAINKDQALRRARRSEHLKVALVGYTNAGKSSLMRALTKSEVLVADRLFATLDTTVRVMHPETKPRILISDTVGFIKKLPHDLVASFRSTLDEALDASLLMFIVDASDPAFRSQLETTKKVLGEIGANHADTLLVLNKVDMLSQLEIAALKREFNDPVFLSTKDKDSVAALHQLIQSHFEHNMIEAGIFVPYAKSAATAEIHATMRVLSEEHDDEGTRLTVKCFEPDLDRIKKQFKLD
jgi:GTP-binding protein HflX